MECVPAAWRKRVLSKFEKSMSAALQAPGGTGRQSDAVRDANVWLLETTERMAALRVPVNLSDSELCEMAREKAREALGLAVLEPGIYVMDIARLRERMTTFVESFGIRAPGCDVLHGPAISRMTDELWWRRALRVSQARNLENEAIRLGYVHRHGERYASDVTVERRGQQRRRNARNLEQTLAVNLDTGEEYKLAELAEKSVANPSIRRGELMTRISGFEAVAKGIGDVAEFVTLTAPSKYHPKRTGANGKPVDNPKYQGATPRDAQKYLVKVWALIRAKLARMAVRVYGFRIAEPHHDACPHWHMILFCCKSEVKALRGVISLYALREDGSEAGAQENRVKFVTIDPRKGSAAGYVAKYVSKNIDGGGYQVQGDLEGGAHDAYVPTPRVEAWASTWGIRQFQQIGGAPVGVWRELRRTNESESMAGVTKAALSAADAGNWARYTEVMGGPTVKRSALPISVAYREKDKPNRYGEMGGVEVCGVNENLFDGVTFSRVYESRRFAWEIRRGAAKLRPWTCVNNCTGEVAGNGEAVSGVRRKGGEDMGGSASACQNDGSGIHGADFGSPTRHGGGFGQAGKG